MTWSPNPKDNRAFAAGETVKIRYEVLPYTQGNGYDIGCGSEKLWRSSIGIDQGGRAANIAGDVRRLPLQASGTADYVYSSHCLEDVEDTVATLAEWWRLLKVGGHLVLYLPHADHYPRRGQRGANPAHKHDFVPEDIVKAMQQAAPDWVLRENQERSEGDEYSFLQVYTKRAPGKGQGAALELTDPAKRCIVVRVGGYGDALVAASTFPHLKAEGWHVTVYTGPKGGDVLRFDPNVDRVVTFDILQLRGPERRDLYRYLSERCARFVNFGGTMEGLFLADPSGMAFTWSHEMRHRYLNGNYLEAAHQAAGVPQDYRQKHYAMPTEIEAARKWRAEMPHLAVITMTGSGVNKIWPGVFEYAWRMVERNAELHVAVLGDLKGAEFIEHPRLHVIGETWGIRESLALAQVADLVIGPETGVLNSVALELMPKIVLLSHSSVENLTKHWIHTEVLAGDVSCYPCHRLHADWRGCRQDPETKMAACQAAIAPMAAVSLSELMLGLDRRKAA